MGTTATTERREPQRSEGWTTRTLASFRKSKREEIRITVDERPDPPLRLVNVRVWFNDGGTMKPGKGIAMRVETFGAFAHAVAEAEAKLSGSFA